MSSLVINEIVGSTTSTDIEYIELFGPAGMSLAGVSLLIVESDAGTSNGTIDRRLDFDATDVIGGNGFFLLGNATVADAYGVTPNRVIAENYVENSSYTVALVETASISGGAVTGSEVVIDALGVSDGDSGDTFAFGAPVIGPDGSFLPAGGRRLEDGVDTDTADDWAFTNFNNSPTINTPTAGEDVISEPVDPVINAVLGSTPGNDVEFVELFGTPGASLEGLSLVIVEGDDPSGPGTYDRRIDFTSDHVFGDNGFFLAGNSLVDGQFGVAPDLEFSTNFIENSAYTIALVETDSLSGSSVAGGERVVDAVALSDAVTNSDDDNTFFFDAPVLGPNGEFLPAGVRRVEDGVDTNTPEDFFLVDFNDIVTGNVPTRGGTDPILPDPELLTIMEIQGDGLETAFEDVFVQTSGVITALEIDPNNGNILGAYLQDAQGDGDTSTSDAIFLQGGLLSGLSVGDAVTLTGFVTEREASGGPDDLDLDITALAVEEIVSQTADADLPDAVILETAPLAAPDAVLSDARDYFESLEGMLVTATDLISVSATNRFGEIFATSGDAASGTNSLGGLTLTETDYNPEKIQIEGLNFDTPIVQTGADLGDVTGVISYEFGNYELLATEDFSAQVIDNTDLAPAITDLQGTDTGITVASYNVLNLDPNDSDGDTDIADGRFETIAEQIVTNLASPDVIGLQEIQDNTGSVNDGTTDASETLARLVQAIQEAGGPTYEVVTNTFITNNASGGQPGANIQTAFLYNPDRVSLQEGSVQTIGGQDEGEAFEGARLPLVATFEFGSEEITVVNNHFSSKGGSAPLVGLEDGFEANQDDPDVNGSVDERLRQAEAVKDFVADLLLEAPEANVTVVGDFNEFDFNPPLEVLESAGLTNLGDSLDPVERFTFNFQGNAQALDHVLASDALLEGAELDIVHTNSVFAATSARASDHDPLVAYFELLEPTVDTEIVSVELVDRFFGSRAIITDAEGGIDRDQLKFIEFRGVEFEQIGVSVAAEGGKLTGIDGGFGVAGFSSESFRDYDEVNTNQALVLSIDDGQALGAALSFDMADGLVDVDAFLDGVAVDLGAETFAVEDNVLQLETDAAFNELVLGYAGDDFALQGFEIERVVGTAFADDALAF